MWVAGSVGENRMKLGTRRLRVASLMLLTTLVAASCNAQPLRAFSDSILAEPGNFVPPPPGQAWHGDEIKAKINQLPTDDPNSKVYVAGWSAQPGQTMVSHSMRAQLNSVGSAAFDQPYKIGLFSFGTNDAATYSTGVAGSYTSAIGKVQAEFWIQKSVDAGATCVIWVLGRQNNPAFNGNALATALYNAWMLDFNNYLRSINGTRTYNGKSYLFTTVDWGALAINNPANTMPDGQHPSVQGARALGDLVYAQALRCPA